MEHQIAAGLFLMGLNQSNIQKAIQIIEQYFAQVSSHSLDYDNINQTYQILLKNAQFIDSCLKDRSFNVKLNRNVHLYQYGRQLMLKARHLQIINDMIVIINNGYLIIINQQLQQHGLIYLSQHYKQSDELCIIDDYLFVLNFKDQYIIIYSISNNKLIQQIDILDIYQYMYQDKRLFKIQKQFISSDTSFFTSKNNLYLYDDSTLIRFDQTKQDFVQILQIISDDSKYYQNKISKGNHFNESVLLVPLTVQNYICLCVVLLDQQQNSYIFDANSGQIVVHSNYKMFYLLFQNNDETLADDGYPLYIQSLDIMSNGQLVVGFSNATQLIFIHDFTSKLLEIFYQNDSKFLTQISQESFKALNIYDYFCYSTISLINVRMIGKFKLTLPCLSVLQIQSTDNIMACLIEMRRKCPIQKYLTGVQHQEESPLLEYTQQIIYIIDITSLEVVQVIYLNENERVIQFDIKQKLQHQHLLFFESTQRAVTVNLNNMMNTSITKPEQGFQSVILGYNMIYLNDSGFITSLQLNFQQNINISLTPTSYLLQYFLLDTDYDNKQQKMYEIRFPNDYNKERLKQQFQMHVKIINTIMESEVAIIVLIDNTKLIIKSHGAFVAFIVLTIFDPHFKMDIKDPQQQKILNQIGCNINNENIQKIIESQGLSCEFQDGTIKIDDVQDSLNIQDGRQFYYDFNSYREVANRLTLSNINNSAGQDSIQQIITFNEYVNKFDYQISMANNNVSEVDESYVNFNSAYILSRAIDGNIIGEISDPVSNHNVIEQEDVGEGASEDLLSTLINRKQEHSTSQSTESSMSVEKPKVKQKTNDNVMIQSVKQLNQRYKYDYDLQLAQLEERVSETTYIPLPNDSIYLNYQLFKKSLLFVLDSFPFLNEQYEQYYYYIRELIKNPIDSGFYQIKSCILVKLGKIYIYRMTLQKFQNLTKQILVFPLQKGYVSSDQKIILTQMSGILLQDRIKYFQTQILNQTIQNIKQMPFIQYIHVRLQERFIVHEDLLEALFEDARNIVDQKPKIYDLIHQLPKFQDKGQKRQLQKQIIQVSSDSSDVSNQQSESEYVPNDSISAQDDESIQPSYTQYQTQYTNEEYSYSNSVGPNLNEQDIFMDSLTVNHLTKFSVSEDIQVVQLPQDIKYKSRQNKSLTQQQIDKLTLQFQTVDLYKYIYYFMPELYEIRYGDSYFITILQQFLKKMFPQSKNQLLIQHNCQIYVVRQLMYSFQQQSLGLSRYLYSVQQQKEIENEPFKLQMSKTAWQQLDDIINSVQENQTTDDKILECFMELFTKDGELLTDLVISTGQENIDKNVVQFNNVTSTIYKSKHKMRIQISNGNAVYVLIILQRLQHLSRQYTHQSAIQTLLYNKSTGNNIIKLIIQIITSRFNNNEVIYNYLLQLNEDYHGQYRDILFEVAQYLQKQSFSIFETKSSFKEFKTYDYLWKKEVAQTPVVNKQKKQRRNKQKSTDSEYSGTYTGRSIDYIEPEQYDSYQSDNDYDDSDNDSDTGYDYTYES